MMTTHQKLKPLPPRIVIKVLGKAGFQKIRQKGSHIFMEHPDGRTTLIPFHAGEDLGRGLLRKIIKDAELTREEFLKLLKPR